MTNSTQTIEHRRIYEISPTRKLVVGIAELFIAAVILFGFVLNTAPGTLTRFVMTPGGIDIGTMPDWVIPTLPTLILLFALSVVIGVYQLMRGFGRATNGMVGLCGLFLIFSFITWQAGGRSVNLGGMLTSAVLLAVPITMGAFSGILSERAGVINIAIEGMMLMASMVGAVIGSITNSAWIGLLAAVLSGLLLSLIHGVLSIKYKINQIISGTVINIFSAGLTGFLSQTYLYTNQALNNPPMFTRIQIPLLARIPLLGPMFFNTNVFVYMMFFFLILIQVALFSTRWGLRLRSVGEHPRAADTLGINVIRTRYVAVLLSGLVAGIAGAFFTLGSVGRFNEGMTAGKGFIGLAAMIFGNWRPMGALGAGFIFGFADAIGSRLMLLGSAIPPQIMAMSPYIITMIVLAGFIGKGDMPAADGEPYEKE